MATLLLAEDIAEVVTKAANDPAPFDIEAVADRLAETHPEAEATREEIADALRHEGSATGAVPPKPTEF